MKIHNISGQDKDEKDQKIVSHLPWFIDLLEDSIYYLLNFNEWYQF